MPSREAPAPAAVEREDATDEAEAPPGGPLTDMERFFDLFADRKLASDLFALAEDARIDVQISKEYGGIRRPYGERQERGDSDRWSMWHVIPLRHRLLIWCVHRPRPRGPRSMASAMSWIADVGRVLRAQSRQEA